tara:strand:+ start:302 stop:1003 length:702 start_codon:yes stop_codon:yes gene_type:complete
MTGCASLLLECGATTIHSWSGLGVRLNEPIETIVKNTIRKYGVRKRWKMIDILVIDEISMLSKKMFEILNHLGKVARNNDSYFGGIQLIFSGDFYQLPPIGEVGDIDTYKFCFESQLWKHIFKNQIELCTIFRQRNSKYIKILNQVRKGGISRKSYTTLLSCVGKDTSLCEIKPVRLYPRKKLVEKVYEEQLNNLTGEAVKFISKTLSTNQEITSKRDLEIFKRSGTSFYNGD